MLPTSAGVPTSRNWKFFQIQRKKGQNIELKKNFLIYEKAFKITDYEDGNKIDEKRREKLNNIKISAQIKKICVNCEKELSKTQKINIRIVWSYSILKNLKY